MSTNTSASASQEYLRNAVLTASHEQLQLMLLDGAIRFSRRAIEAIEARDIERSFDALDRAQRIVLQLAAGLRREVNPPIVDRMTALFEFVHSRLVEANITRRRGPVDDALRILEHQRETWVLLMEKLAREGFAPLAAAPAQATPGERPSKPTLCLEI